MIKRLDIQLYFPGIFLKNRKALFNISKKLSHILKFTKKVGSFDSCGQKSLAYHPRFSKMSFFYVKKLNT